MSDPLRERLTALVATWRETATLKTWPSLTDPSPEVAQQVFAECADALAALLAAPEAEPSIGPNVMAHLVDFLSSIIHQHGCNDHVWLETNAIRLYKGVEAARAAAPEGKAGD